MKQPIYNQQGRTACVLHFNVDKLTSEVSKCLVVVRTTVKSGL